MNELLFDAASPLRKILVTGREETSCAAYSDPRTGPVQVEQVVIDATNPEKPRLLISNRIRTLLVEAGWRHTLTLPDDLGMEIATVWQAIGRAADAHVEGDTERTAAELDQADARLVVARLTARRAVDEDDEPAT